MKRSLLSIVLLLVFAASSALAQTGKIAGTVTEAESGEPLPGCNIIVVGTQMGAATDENGEYTILNVPPGTYDVRAQMIGYTTVTVTDVDVTAGLTRAVDYEMQVEAIAGQEVVVEAQRPIVQEDISGTQRNIETQEIESSAHVSISDIITTQVGINRDRGYDDQPSIRGSGMNKMNFIVDGVSQRDAMSNRPHLRLNVNEIQEVKVQTGGFNAEYGDIQSGVVQVVTKEGGDQYSGSFDYEYSPPGLKHFGPNMYGFQSPVVIPFTDPEAGAFTGNDFFAGWNEEANENLQEDDPHYGKPEELYARYLWRHRSKDAMEELQRLADGEPAPNGETVDLQWGEAGVPDYFHWYGDRPDYNVRATLGGPVPIIPNLRFFLSYNQEFLEYSNQFAQLDGFSGHRFRGKLTGNVTENMKVQFMYFNSSEQGGTGGQGPGISGYISRNPYAQLGWVNKMWYPHCAVPGQQDRQYFSGRLTQTLSPKTFYDLQITHRRVDYSMLPDFRNTAPIEGSEWGATSSDQTAVENGRIGSAERAERLAEEGEYGWENWRDWAMIQIGDYWYDEGPKGYGPVNWRDITGEYRMESCNLRANDTYSRTWEITGSITSQVNQNNEVKAGFELRRDFLHQYYAAIDPSVNAGSIRELPDLAPLNGALYLQDKMEYGGFIANLGLRADWIVHDEFPLLDGPTDDKVNGPYSDLLLPGNTDRLWEEAELKRVKKLRLSPRLGISHPIARVAKIFFNYGHFYQWPDYDDVYRTWKDTRARNAIENFGNPALDPPRTIAYELGYEHNLFNRMSLSITGYYKDVNAEYGEIEYNYIEGYEHDSFANRLFEDTRGAEARLELRRGSIPFFSFWTSIDYMVQSGGEYGTDDFFEDPTVPPEIEYREVSAADVRPAFKLNLNFNTPREFGPSYAGFFYPVGGISLDLLYKWQRGEQFTWNPQDYPLVENNIRWRPYQRWDMRLRKPIFSRGTVTASLYLDVKNLFNNKNMTRGPWADWGVTGYWAWDAHKWWNNEFRSYMESLDLEVQKDGSIKGDDRPGDYAADYIDLPAFTSWSFLEKRDVFFGVSFRF